MALMTASRPRGTVLSDPRVVEGSRELAQARAAEESAKILRRAALEEAQHDDVARLQWSRRAGELDSAVTAATVARMRAERIYSETSVMVSAETWEAALPRLKTANAKLHEALLALRDGPYRELTRAIDATVVALGPGLTDARQSTLHALRWPELEPLPEGGRIEISRDWWATNWPGGD